MQEKNGVKISNKKLGNFYENELLKKLKELGFWCHLFAYSKNGQPCDVIAVRDNDAIFIDVKHCKEDRFSFEHIQPNQLTCFDYARLCGNSNTGFAIYFEKQEKWYWLSFKKVIGKSIRYDELEELECFL